MKYFIYNKILIFSIFILFGACSVSDQQTANFHDQNGVIVTTQISPVLNNIRNKKIYIRLNGPQSDTEVYELQLVGQGNRTKARYVTRPQGAYYHQTEGTVRWATDSKLFDVIVNTTNKQQIIIYIPDGHPQGKQYLFLWGSDRSSEVLAAFTDTPKFLTSEEYHQVGVGLGIVEWADRLPDSLYSYNFFDVNGRLFNEHGQLLNKDGSIIKPKINPNPLPKNVSPILDNIRNKKLWVRISSTEIYELQLVGQGNRTKARYVTRPQGANYYQTEGTAKWATDSRVFDVIINTTNKQQLIIHIPDGHPQGKRYLGLWGDPMSGSNEVQASFLDTPRFLTPEEYRALKTVQAEWADKLPDSLYRYDDFKVNGKIYNELGHLISDDQGIIRL